ncbi:unnamed protein product, partial [Agarophyton chilense]
VISSYGNARATLGCAAEIWVTEEGHYDLKNDEDDHGKNGEKPGSNAMISDADRSALSESLTLGISVEAKRGSEETQLGKARHDCDEKTDKLRLETNEHHDDDVRGSGKRGTIRMEERHAEQKHQQRGFGTEHDELETLSTRSGGRRSARRGGS